MSTGYGTETRSPNVYREPTIRSASRRIKRALKWLVDPWASRLRLGFGVRPLSGFWGVRGGTIHRHYLEQFLEEHASSIRGRCLEFQEDSYSTRFGKDRVQVVDVINKEPDAAGSTIVADLTVRNEIPNNHFDCIICTYVLHQVPFVERMVAELHRILKPGGTLLACAPDISIHYDRFPEFWRFTTDGLHALLARSFDPENVVVRGYGNSLVAAGEIRGLAYTDFRPDELERHDPRYSLIVCARAVKASSPIS